MLFLKAIERLQWYRECLTGSEKDRMQMDRRILHWNYRNFHNVPEELITYSDYLEDIYLKENYIVTLPVWMFELSNLKFIHLAGNLIECIPEEICLLENLAFLDMSNNKIKKLPTTICFLRKLKHLNVSFNYIGEFPRGLKNLKAIELLNISRNNFRQIPLELASCNTLIEIVMNDNLQLTEVPTKLLLLPNLESLEADRCNLHYLPGIVGHSVRHLRIFNNTKLTHYPMIYERFLKLHYDYWSETVVSADSLMVFLPDACKRTLMSRMIKRLHSSSSRTPLSLFEYALRGLYANRDYYEFILNHIQPGVLPQVIHESVVHGPTVLCGNIPCSMPLFSECYLVLLKKNRSSSQTIYSNMFCCKDCLVTWIMGNNKLFHQIRII